ncbi:MAG: hypothetical protein V3T83_06865 [Acidobacteriota bacterium]
MASRRGIHSAHRAGSTSALCSLHSGLSDQTYLLRVGYSTAYRLGGKRVAAAG